MTGRQDGFLGERLLSEVFRRFLAFEVRSRPAKRRKTALDLSHFHLNQHGPTGCWTSTRFRKRRWVPGTPRLAPGRPVPRPQVGLRPLMESGRRAKHRLAVPHRGLKPGARRTSHIGTRAAGSGGVVGASRPRERSRRRSSRNRGANAARMAMSSTRRAAAAATATATTRPTRRRRVLRRAASSCSHLLQIQYSHLLAHRLTTVLGGAPILLARYLPMNLASTRSPFDAPQAYPDMRLRRLTANGVLASLASTAETRRQSEFG